MKNLKTNFGKAKILKSQKTRKVQNLFTQVTSKYDLMNDLMSFGTHNLWKKEFVKIMNIQKNDYILDVGSGTGDIPSIILNEYQNVNLTCIDLNAKMLKIAKEKLKNKTNQIKWLRCNAEKLPFKNNVYDKYIIAFCLRNVTNIDKCINEAKRVLKPGGTFLCLEFSKPTSTLVNKLYNLYKSRLIPNIGERIAKNKNAYKY